MTQTVFTDTAGLIPATWGDSIARINDGKGVGGSIAPLRNSVQANAALRGSLGRGPLSRRNLLLNTESLTQWFNFAGPETIITLSGETAPEGVAFSIIGTTNGANLGRLAPNPNSMGIFTVPAPARVRFWAKRVSGTRLLSFFNNGVQSIYPVLPNDGQWHLIEQNLVPGSFQILRGWFDSEILVAAPQLELGSVSTPYQRVNSALDMTEAGVPSPAFLRLDLVDDVIPTTFADGLAGDVLVIGRRGSWIERVVTVAAGAALNIGPTTIAGRLPGILSAVGDIVAIIPVDRTMTGGEIDRLIAYYRPLGGRGLLVPSGPELWLDTFTTIPAETTDLGSGDVSFNTTATRVAFNSGTVVPGRRYLAQYTVNRTSGTLLAPYDGTGATVLTHTASGTFQRVLVPLLTNLCVGVTEAGQGSITNISVRELTAS